MPNRPVPLAVPLPLPLPAANALLYRLLTLLDLAGVGACVARLD